VLTSKLIDSSRKQNSRILIDNVIVKWMLDMELDGLRFEREHGGVAHDHSCK